MYRCTGSRRGGCRVKNEHQAVLIPATRVPTGKCVLSHFQSPIVRLMTAYNTSDPVIADMVSIPGPCGLFSHGDTTLFATHSECYAPRRLRVWPPCVSSARSWSKVPPLSATLSLHRHHLLHLTPLHLYSTSIYQLLHFARYGGQP